MTLLTKGMGAIIKTVGKKARKTKTRIFKRSKKYL